MKAQEISLEFEKTIEKRRSLSKEKENIISFITETFNSINLNEESYHQEMKQYDLHIGQVIKHYIS